MRAWFPLRLNLRIKRPNEPYFLDWCFINVCLSEILLQKIHLNRTRFLRLPGGFKLHILASRGFKAKFHISENNMQLAMYQYTKRCIQLYVSVHFQFQAFEDMVHFN